MTFSFVITSRDPSGARCGRLTTPHGTLLTPAFIFCATNGAIKGLTCQQMRESGAEIILANTYHLAIQPGSERVKRMGGLHRMMNWTGPMLTDSGGFQIFSLGHGGVAQEIKSRRQSLNAKTLLKIDENGALFRSYRDGSLCQLTPESSIQIQRDLGADLILTLDECTPFHADRRYSEESTARSHRWEKRSLQEFRRMDTGQQALYGIIQGGIYDDLRRESCQFVSQEPFFGQAIGGTLGGNRQQMHEIVAFTCSQKNPEKPTHLLGIGMVEDIFNGVRHGVDTFDCVHPTRFARHGGALVSGKISPDYQLNLKNSQYSDDTDPIDPLCSCYACQTASRAYIHHLFKAGESLAGQLLSLHNVAFLTSLFRSIRQSISDGTFDSFARDF